ncbi:HEPN domain-containing protein [Modestobacter versicolor]|uniref:HEPN domain-containing protein n=1 Tax=Modestobacter versicolor TaxID=429133 RepID=UPI0034DE7079
MERWSDVATERGADAAHLMTGQRQLAVVYMLGYVVEAYAKALSTARGTRPAKTHEIIDLLEACGIRRQDLPPDMRAFAEQRSVEMRYEVTLQGDYASTVAVATKLAGWLRTRVNRMGGR